MGNGIIAGGSFKGDLKLSDLVKTFSNGAVSLPDGWDVDITAVNAQVDTGGKTYSVGATANISLHLFGGQDNRIVIQQAYFEINANYGQTGGDEVFNAAMGGLFGIGDIAAGDGIFVMLTANYESSGGDWTWNIDAVTVEPIQVSKLVNQLFTSLSLGSFIPGDLVINQMEFQASISKAADAKDSTVTYNASIDISWQYNDSVLVIDIPHAGLSLQYDGGQPTGQQYSGDIYGEFLLSFLDFSIDVSLEYNFGPNESNLVIGWQGVTGTYDRIQHTFTLKFNNCTLGSLIVAFVEMLGIVNFKIDSPWDIINDISLNGIEVIFDLKNNQVTLEYMLPSPIDLVFIKINGLSLFCSKGSVRIGLNATSPIKPDNNEWDQLLDPTKGQDVQNMPAVPGKGSKLFDLVYLGLGQRVSLADISDINTVEDATGYLKTAFYQPADGSIVPVKGSGQTGSIIFDASSSWLAGAQLMLMDTVELSVVFNDPKLYGLLINLSGPRAKAFVGLNFEILYKKITDSLGMYYVELALPEMMRHIEFGAVSITLPVVALNIYTDGTFKIDFGFPASLNDFSRSFTMQAFPFIGSGGFYFGYLDAAAASHIPQTNHGTFHPVIEFGLALQLGLGKTVNEGILSAGISITMTGMVQGTLAWYHPNAGPDSSDFYYWLQGTVGIVGRLFGSINFSIISATLDVDISANIGATLESYHAVLLTLTVIVDVELTVKVDLVFTVTVHLSFHTTLTENLTIGQDTLQDAPWYTQGVGKPLIYKSVPKEHFTRLNQPAGLSYRPTMPLKWKAFKLSDEQKENLQFYFVPHLTVATGPTGVQSAQYVAMLYTDSAGPTGPTGAPAPLSSFELLAKGTLVWVINSFIDSGEETITQKLSAPGLSIGQLQSFLDTLNSETSTPITKQNIQDFLSGYFNIYIAQPDEMKQDLKATVFPMLPGLTLGYNKVDEIDFSTYNITDKTYQQDILNYFEKLYADFESGLEKKNNGSQSRASLIKKSLSELSLSEFVYQDFFLMLAKALVQNSIDFIKGYQINLPAPNTASLNSLTDEFNNINAPGATGAMVHNDIDIATLADRNKSAGLSADTSLWIGGFHVSTPGTVSLLEIAQLYNVSVSALAQVNQTTPGIIASGTVMEYRAPNSPTGAAPDQYKVQPGDTLLDIMAGFSGRITGATGSNGYTITVPAIAEYNQVNPVLDVVTLTVPSRIYGIKTKDTLQAISDRYLSGPQGAGHYFHGTVAVTGPTAGISQVSHLMQTNNFIEGLIAPGTSIAGPTGAGYFYRHYGITNPTGPTAYIVQPKDTLLSLQQTLQVTPEQLAQEIKDQPVLGTGKSITIPSISLNTGPTGGTYTFDILSNKYGLPVYQLAISNANVPGIFEGGQQISIPNLICLESDTIIQGLQDNGSYINQAGLGSRIFLSGLRLPVTGNIVIKPGDPGYGQPIAGLYNLTGQQFEIKEPGIGYEVTLRPTSAESLPGVYFGLAPTGPVGFGSRDPRSGITGPTGNVLVYAPDAQAINWINGVENTMLAVDASFGPLQLYREMPQQYTLRTEIKWQYPGTLTLPFNNPSGQVDAQPYIWMFPQTLLNDLQGPGNKAGLLLDLKTITNSRPGFPVASQALNFFGWATTLSVKIKKLNGSAPIINQTYELIGAREDQVTLLERLLTYINTDSNGDGIIDQIQILYATSAAAGDPNGLQSASLGGADFILTQANLSTVTNPVSSFFTATKVKAQNLINPYGDFIKLLWEASIVRSGGFYLYYNDNSAKTGLPQSLFNQDQIGEITLVVTYKAPAFAGGVQDFANSVVIGDTITAGNSTLYAEALNKLTRVAYVPPGNAGIELLRPPAGQISAEQQYLQENYHLLGYRLAATGGFTASAEGMPISPGPTGPTGASAQTGPAGTMQYSRAFPVFKYYTAGQSNISPTGSTGPTGPPYADNPYLGVGMTATVQLDWVDLFGNKTIGSPSSYTVGVPVGFTDPVVAIAQCPSLSTDYIYQPGATMANLDLEFTFAGSRYKPDGPTGLDGKRLTGGPTGPTAAMNRAAIDIETYKQLFYQIISLGNGNEAGIYLQTSLDPDNRIPLDTTPLLNFIKEIYNYLLDIQLGNFDASLPGKDGILHVIVPGYDTNPEIIFQLEVSFSIVRDLSLVNSGLTGSPNVLASTTTIKPKLTGQPGQTGPTGLTGPPAESLRGFAKDFESTFKDIPNQKLVKIAVGDDRNQISASSSYKNIWVVRMGAEGISFAIKMDQGPFYFAPKPLSNTLLSLAQVPTYTYISGMGITAGSPKTYQSVDLDNWGQQFLGAVDELLTPEFAVPANIISSPISPTGPTGVFNNPAYPGQRNASYAITGPIGVYQRILNAKQEIAGAISAELATIIGPTGPTGASMSEAQEALRQQLLSKLSNAYTISTVIQHPVTVTGTSGPAIASRLFGKPVTTQALGNTRKELRAITRQFGTNSNGPTGADYSLSTAKISLEQTGKSWLTYVFSTKDTAQYKSIDLQMNYEVSNIEHQVGNVPGITGYQASSWLSFILPLDIKTLESAGMQPHIGPTGPIEIPIPLRAYPAPPSLISQGYKAGPTGADNCISSLRQLLNWDYSYSYSEVTAKQDSIQTLVEYNVAVPNDRPMLSAAPITLDIRLAQFIEAYAGIRADLVGSLSKINSRTPSGAFDYQVAANALEAFAFLAENVASAWPAWPEVTNNRKVAMGDANAYTISEANDDGFLKVSVDSLASPVNPVVPFIGIPGYNTLPTGPASITGHADYWYENADGKLTYENGVTISSRTVDFDGLDILQTQSAWGGVSIIRNLNLLKAQPNVFTNDYFVYQTPLIRQKSPLVPLINIGQAINIACLGKTQPVNKPMALHLSTLFSDLLATAPAIQLLKVKCGYAYSLRDDYPLDGIILPILASVPLEFAVGKDWNIGMPPYCTGEGSFVCGLTQTITQWLLDHGLEYNTASRQESGPYHYDGKLIFEIEVYSNAAHSLPLLQLNNLYLEVINIIWT